jgi:hypothetical protein
MMNEAPAEARSSLWFNIFKYSVFALLGFNAVQYFLQDYAASQQVFGAELQWSQVVEAYAVTIDTLSWIMLLFMFDLETSVLSRDVLKKPEITWIIGGIKALCYGFIVYALYGYIIRLLGILAFEPSEILDLCAHLSDDLVFMNSLDLFSTVDTENCASLVSGDTLYRDPAKNRIADINTLSASQDLALTDVINASTWILIVIILEADDWIKSRFETDIRLAVVLNFAKVTLYSFLLGCAIFWGFSGVFLDFWDAFLWIVAFAFIELNVFDYRDKTSG